MLHGFDGLVYSILYNFVRDVRFVGVNESKVKETPKKEEKIEQVDMDSSYVLEKSLFEA